jgi:hypothetical protein
MGSAGDNAVWAHLPLGGRPDVGLTAMTIERASIRLPKRAAFACAFACAFSCALAIVALTTAAGFAQEPGNGASSAEQPNFLATIGRWLDRQAENIHLSFRNAGKDFEDFGHEAGIAARTTVDHAKGAADAVARLPKTSVASGHAKCGIAPNGAPDCLAAAASVCKASGFRTGKSLDMTTAEICPPKVYLAGRNSGPGCRTETFVSRALCQ